MKQVTFRFQPVISGVTNVFLAGTFNDWNDSKTRMTDSDNDGVGDLCDGCPADPTNDGDGDGLCAGVDNCPLVTNAGQEDGETEDGKAADELIDHADQALYHAKEHGRNQSVCFGDLG